MCSLNRITPDRQRAEIGRNAEHTLLSRKTGAGALRGPVLVALGLRHDGKKEFIDFRLVAGESATVWEKFLADLYRRGSPARGST